MKHYREPALTLRCPNGDRLIVGAHVRAELPRTSTTISGRVIAMEPAYPRGGNVHIATATTFHWVPLEFVTKV